ncbi:MAG: aminoacetone oxidase family FAD-binding enzyme [Blautia sp.]|nr:aminoacetone oxidase family FAD-binding enzyme [Blautia sp.]
MNRKKIIIVGAGASGLMAAIAAAEKGASVTILEQNDRPGRKLLATGNGRCNLTNLGIDPDAYHGTDTDFCRDALRFLPVSDTIRFFSKLGIYTRNKDGWIYPGSMQASSVLELLLLKAQDLGIRIRTGTRAEQLIPGWTVKVPGWEYEADAVILACGSRASGITGSDGSGYELARMAGHTIVKPLPALTGLVSKETPAWGGVRAYGRVTLFSDDHVAAEESGELQLTEYGISGIPVFQISSRAIRALDEGRTIHVSLDFVPDFSLQELRAFLKVRQEDCPYKHEKDLFTGMLPDKLCGILAKTADPAAAAKDYRLTITAGRPFETAQVCSGGVRTSEVDPVTMESRLAKGLYFAGELLDIDGPCGGYNLQWAWSSGACAGHFAACMDEEDNVR